MNIETTFVFGGGIIYILLSSWLAYQCKRRYNDTITRIFEKLEYTIFYIILGIIFLSTAILTGIILVFGYYDTVLGKGILITETMFILLVAIGIITNLAE